VIGFLLAVFIDQNVTRRGRAAHRVPVSVRDVLRRHRPGVAMAAAAGRRHRPPFARSVGTRFHLDWIVDQDMAIYTW
jgi:hypothetical protein